MAFARAAALGPVPVPSQLTRDMVGIGFNLAAESNPHAAIEETLVHASAAGMDGGDLRVLSVLTTWLEVHRPRVHVDRLVRCVDEHPRLRVKAYWAGVARWLRSDRRFARLERAWTADRVDLLDVGTEFQVARRGEDERFTDTAIRVPAGTLRVRVSDVVPPELLVGRHPGYRNRVLMGPTWRADLWTVLEAEPELAVADVARRATCSFAAAWQVVQDHRLLRHADG